MFMSPKELHDALQPLSLSAEGFAEIVEIAKCHQIDVHDLAQSDLHRFLQELRPDIIVGEKSVTLNFEPSRILGAINPNTSCTKENRKLPSSQLHTIQVQVTLKRSGMGTRMQIEGRSNDPDPALLRLLAKARIFQDHVIKSEATSMERTADEKGIARSYLIRVLRLNFLAPDIVKAILQGKQPPELTARKLMLDTRFPLDWNEQRKRLGFDHRNFD